MAECSERLKSMVSTNYPKYSWIVIDTNDTLIAGFYDKDAAQQFILRQYIKEIEENPSFYSTDILVRDLKCWQTYGFIDNYLYVAQVEMRLS